ncbi:MAG: hypothetical protein ABR524_12385 [Thermoanaerobaculia bacterium]
METNSRNRLIVIVLVAVLAAVLLFLAGLIPATTKARAARAEASTLSAEASTLSAELEQMRLERDLARMQGMLGMVMYEANRNNFAAAGELSTEFFDGLRRTLSDPALAAGTAARFEPFMNRRDEISADLAVAESGVKEKLAQMYVEFAAALDGA